jgi:hypothetical protein
MEYSSSMYIHEIMNRGSRCGDSGDRDSALRLTLGRVVPVPRVVTCRLALRHGSVLQVCDGSSESRPGRSCGVGQWPGRVAELEASLSQLERRDAPAPSRAAQSYT